MAIHATRSVHLPEIVDSRCLVITMDVFDLRLRLVEDYARYTRSFIKPTFQIWRRKIGNILPVFDLSCVECSCRLGRTLG
jgi:hypothetical protein